MAQGKALPIGFAIGAVPVAVVIAIATGAASPGNVMLWLALAAGVGMSIAAIMTAGGPVPESADAGADGGIGRTVYQTSVDGVLVLSDSAVVDCNPAAVRMLNARSKAEVVGRHPSQLSPERQADGRLSSDLSRELIGAAIRDGSVRFEWLHRRADGSTFPVAVTLVATSIGGQPRIVCFWQDIAELAKLREERGRTIREVSDSLQGVAGVIRTAAASLTEGARNLNANAERAHRRVADAASAADHASSNVGTVASAAEELATTIADITRRIADRQSVATAAAQEVEQANATVAGLSEAARKIGEVVVLINSIASQTNLLALNATIEAARAGEAGKGFAVVAQEVKNLANQTAKATEDIQAQVAQMQSVTGAAVDAMGRISRTISDMNEMSSAIAVAVGEQGAATREIARNVTEASTGTRQVSQGMADLLADADDTGRLAGEVAGTAHALLERADGLRGEVDRFVRSLGG